MLVFSYLLAPLVSSVWNPRVRVDELAGRLAPHVVDSRARVRHCSLTMKTATVRDLRNRFPRVAAWIEQGEPVEITRAGKVFARLVPAKREKAGRFKMPDIMARLRANFGDKIYSAEEVQGLIQESRGERS